MTQLRVQPYRTSDTGLASRPRVAVAVLFALAFAVKLPTLSTPAYWDEVGWLTQAEWLSNTYLVRALPGLRPAAMFFGHPPGLHTTLAVLYKLFGHSMIVAHLLIAAFSALGVCSTYLLGRLLYDNTTGWLAALFLLLSPIYLVQSGMFLADVPVAALAVTSAYLALTKRYVPYLVCASYMVLLKEPAIAFVAALVTYLWLVNHPRNRAETVATLKYATPLAVIGAFVLLQKMVTGQFFSIYDYEFNLFDLTAANVAVQFEHITEWIFVNQLRWVLTALIAFDLLRHGLRARTDVWLVLLIIVCSGYSFTVLYYLPRYLLPTWPFFLILGAHAVLALVRTSRAKLAIGTVAVAAMVVSLFTQPYYGNNEFNLHYLEAVAVDREMAQYIADNYQGVRVLTSWPQSTSFRNPFVGYVDTPLEISVLNTNEYEGRQTDLIFASTMSAEPAASKTLAADTRLQLVKQLQTGNVIAALYSRKPAN